MDRESHLAIDRILTGRTFNDVHAWLDSSFPKYRGFEHWREHHHWEAINEKYSDDHERKIIAVMHIYCDFASRGMPPILPNNEEDVLETLRRFHVIPDPAVP
jgi:hypothetical protein